MIEPWLCSVGLMLCARGERAALRFQTLWKEGPTGYPLIVAHRGASYVAPKNTLLAFTKALDMGAHAIEFDVRMTRDGRLVLMDDETVDRTTDGHGAVAELSFEEIPNLNIDAKFPAARLAEPVPTLAEAHRLAKGRGGVLIEAGPSAPQRRAGNARGVAELVRGLELYSVSLVMSFDLLWIQELHALDPPVWTGALVGAKWRAREGNDRGRAVRKRVEICHPDVIAPLKDITGNALVKSVHARGRKFFVWTVNQPEDFVRMAQLCVDAIITDRPGVALHVLGQVGSISSGGVPSGGRDYRAGGSGSDGARRVGEGEES